MSSQTIERVLASPTLPSLPTVAVEVLELTRDPNIALPKLAKSVENDPALAARILKTVNSSFYGLSKPCPTITRALAYLGMNTVKSLVLGFSLAESFVDDENPDPFGFSYTDLWRSAVYSAASAHLIASERTRDTDPDEAFMAGLLQDIGILAGAWSLETEYTMVVGPVCPSDNEIVDREREVLGFDHCELGHALGSRWKLPPEIVEVVENHHAPEEVDPEQEELLRCVIVGRMAAAVIIAEPEEKAKARQVLATTCQDWFGMDGNESSDWLGRVDKAARELGKLFSVPEGEHSGVQEVIAEASDRLLEHQITMDQENDRLAREQDRLLHDALTDGLTNAPNRKRFDMFLEETFARAQRDDLPMSVILLDADHFKQLNDTLGHQAGDAVLIELARRGADVVGEGGLFARYGGEEFAIVLPGADAAEGGRVAERVRKSICASPFDLTDVPCKENSTDVTVSCGVSAREPGSRDTLKSAATLLRAADKAVYAAKESGRNRVRVVRLRPPGQAKNPAPAAAPDADSHSDAAATHESPVEAGAAPSAEAGIEPAARLKILVVEDEKLQQKLITLPLENSGEYEPIVAADATTALKHLGIEPASDPLNPSFMLIDLGLPDFSGVELVRRIREHEAYKITPIVILSASEVANDVAAVMNAGANAFVAKNEIADDPRRRVLDLAAFWSRMIPAAAA